MTASHRSDVATRPTDTGAAKHIHLEQLPAYYAPELNPAEGIWWYLKRVELRNERRQRSSQIYVRMSD
mgnify:CR=1 FL=1